jgi:predicted O-methyltransferase YrrM
MNIYIPREQGDLLYSLVRLLQPERTVEIGMANGLSTLFLASGLEDNGAGHHVAIDPYQTTDWGGAALALLRNAGLDHRVELVEKPSHQALPEMEQAGVKAQLVFVDGSHLFDYVMTDFVVADRILDVGGVMAFDDSDWPAVNQVIRYVICNRQYEVFPMQTVIEPPPYHPSLPGRFLRAVGRAIPALGAKLRPDFATTSHDLGLEGRFVVLKKLGDDDRDSQSRFHENF